MDSSWARRSGSRYGLSFGRRQTNFWGLPVSGNVFALIGVGFVFLSGAFSSFLLVVPSAVALLLTWAYLRIGGPSDWLLRLQGWRLQRQLRSRSKHLSVVSPERNTPRDSDRFSSETVCSTTDSLNLGGQGGIQGAAFVSEPFDPGDTRCAPSLP